MYKTLDKSKSEGIYDALTQWLEHNRYTGSRFNRDIEYDAQEGMLLFRATIDANEFSCISRNLEKKDATLTRDANGCYTITISFKNFNEKWWLVDGIHAALDLEAPSRRSLKEQVRDAYVVSGGKAAVGVYATHVNNQATFHEKLETSRTASNQLD